MKWYNQKELSAGVKRLVISWYLYKVFGKKAAEFIAFLVSFFTFIFSKQIRKITAKNLNVIYEFTNNPNSKPTFLNCYKNVLNYALSLVDKMETYARTFDINKLDFVQDTDKEELLELMQNKKGVFFLCSHIGNVEVLRIFISNPKNFVWPANPHVNIFLSKNQCRVFKDFLSRISVEANFSTYAVEDTDITTAVEMEEKLKNGDILFMAGDRISPNAPNASFCADFLNRKVNFPVGSFKFAQPCGADVYFICALKDRGDFYKIYVQKFIPDNKLSKKQNLENMQKGYVNFLQQAVKIAPLQFYHFYDLFE